MGPLTLPYAFSAGHFIASVGADAGFAAIVGLGILALLYFAQARETAALREQQRASAQQVQELEARLAGLARSQAALGAAPVPAAAPGAAPGGGPPSTSSPAVAPAPPAGVGAPALNAATKLIPDPGGATGVAGTPATAAGTGAYASGPPAPDQTVIGRPPPSTVAALANGGAREGAPRRPGPQPDLQASPRPAAAPVPRIPIRPAVPGQRAARAGTWRRLAILLIVLAAVAGVAVLLVVTSIGGGKQAATGGARTSNAPLPGHKAHPARFNPASITVAVLNGTATSGLAHKVAVRLRGAGYKEGTIGNTVDQTRTATVVSYLPGHKRAGLAVASSLNLASASVRLIDQSTQAIACPPPSPCSATVAVTVGSDLAIQ